MSVPSSAILTDQFISATSCEQYLHSLWLSYGIYSAGYTVQTVGSVN